MFPLIAVLSTQPALTCAKSTIKAPQHCIKLVQSYDKKTPKRRHCCRSGVIFGNFEQILHIVLLVLPLLTLSM